MVTIAQAAADLLSKLSVEVAANATALQQQDTVIAINGAMQLMVSAGQDFITRQKVTIPTVIGQQVYPLASSIQAVIGPIRLAGAPLKALTSRGEVDQFDRIYLGSASYGAAPGTPLAYFVEFLNNAATTGDTTLANLYLCPVPIAVASMELEVIKDAIAYAISDLTSTNVLPIAQNYSESIFLPIARMLVIRSSTFSRPDIAEQIEKDGTMALERLGIFGGFPNAVQPGPDRKVAA